MSKYHPTHLPTPEVALEMAAAREAWAADARGRDLHGTAAEQELTALLLRAFAASAAPRRGGGLIDHPAHYGGDSVYETIKIQEAKLSREEFVGAMKFQVSKYLDRSGKKTEDALEDWLKAQFYLDYLVDYAERSVSGAVGEGRAALVRAGAPEGRWAPHSEVAP